MGVAFRAVRYLFVLFFLLPLALSAADNRAASGYRSGTTRWGVLNALGRDAQLQLQKARQYQLFGALPRANADVGNVAVVNADSTILVQANPFDLSLGNPSASVTFTPTPDTGGYRVQAGGYAVYAAGLNGTVLSLQDDDTKSVAIGFSFPFFDHSYDSVFVNSDGNLTFGGGDVATSERDLSRLLTGLPRIAPFFADLNPSDPAGGQVRVLAEAGRFTLTWRQVRECCAPPVQPFATAQVSLYPDGRIVFAYDFVSVESAVVGISPGAFFSTPRIVHFSDTTGNEVITLPIAEVFVPRTTLSEPATARKFYETHEDAYDFLIFFTNIQPEPYMHGAFAYEINIANDITGIGDATYNYAADLGSGGHLSSFVNMGGLSKFPGDPTQIVVGIAPNTTVSVMGQEAGHRWLTKYLYPFNSNPRSNVLLGRDDDHWSFLFNSDGSVMEGNTITDNHNGTFTTGKPVWHYNTFDQYGMGLIPAEQVIPSFVVVNASPSYDPATFPRSASSPVTFSGTRLDVTIDKIIQANGARLPAAAVANKNFRFAFILLNGTGTSAPAADVAKIDNIRLSWESFWGVVTSGLSSASTQVLRGVSLLDLPASVASGAQISVRLRAGSTDGGTFALTASNSNVTVPASVIIPAGSREVSFQVTGNTAGVSSLKATASGYETAEGSVSVASAAQVQLRTFSGDGQVGLPSGTLQQPLVVEARDSYSLPVAGAQVQFSAPAGASLNPAAAVTDASGHAQTVLTLGPTAGTSTVTAALSGSSSAVSFQVSTIGQAIVPPGSAVNGASFAAGAAVSPGSIVSVFGTNLAAAGANASCPTPGQACALPTSLSGASVTVGGVAAPLFYAGPGQINLQIPFDLSGSVNLVVNNGVSMSAPLALVLAPTGPGVFLLDPSTPDPDAHPAILHDSLHGGGIVQSSNAAPAGDVVSVYCTGLGAVTNPVPTGQPAPVVTDDSLLSRTVSTTAATIGGRPATVWFSGLAPTFVGLYQVNVEVPTGLSPAPPGLYDLVLSSGSASSKPVKIAVR